MHPTGTWSSQVCREPWTGEGDRLPPDLSFYHPGQGGRRADSGALGPGISERMGVSRDPGTQLMMETEIASPEAAF